MLGLKNANIRRLRTCPIPTESTNHTSTCGIPK